MEAGACCEDRHERGESGSSGYRRPRGTATLKVELPLTTGVTIPSVEAGIHTVDSVNGVPVNVVKLGRKVILPDVNG
ncbi:unnamed protein product [Urochloa humidicola]